MRTTNRKSVVLKIISWESHSAGFDDGDQWIEFNTDQAGLERLLHSRNYARHDDLKHPDDFWRLLEARGWRENVIQYEADELLEGGRVFNLAYRTVDGTTNVLLYGTHQ